MQQPPGEEALMLISDAFGKGGIPNYSHLLPLTKTGENPTKTWRL